MTGGLPFAPRRVQGRIFEDSGGRRLIMWEDHHIEPTGDNPADDGTLGQFLTLLASGRRPMRIVDGVLQSAYEGFRLIGTREWHFRSGELYQQATVLLDAAKKANARRTELVLAYEGKEPDNKGDLTDFYEATMTVGAACNAVMVIALAGVEVFANEVLSCQYNLSKTKLGKMNLIGGPTGKVDILLDKLGISSDQPWFEIIRNAQRRRSDEIVHFKPSYVDDFDLKVTPLSPSDLPDDAEALVRAVHQFHTAVFAACGLPVSETHWDWRSGAEAYWQLLNETRG